MHLLLGTGLLASGAAALNQWLERDYDAQMRRTEDRPLPAGRLQPETVLFWGSSRRLPGCLSGVGGEPPAGVLGAVTLLTYLFVYTPLKRVTWLNTIVGAVPGALPPLIGWTARRGNLGARAGRCLPSWRCGRSLIFLRSPGCIGTITPGRLCDAAGGGPDGAADGAAGGGVHLVVVGCESFAVVFRADRPRLPGGGRDAGAFSRARASIPSGAIRPGRARVCFTRRSCICRCCWG
jgi:hypothetical protein